MAASATDGYSAFAEFPVFMDVDVGCMIGDAELTMGRHQEVAFCGGETDVCSGGSIVPVA